MCLLFLIKLGMQLRLFKFLSPSVDELHEEPTGCAPVYASMLCAIRKQKDTEVDLSVQGCYVKRRVTLIVLFVDIVVELDKYFGAFNGTDFSCAVQGCGAINRFIEGS